MSGSLLPLNERSLAAHLPSIPFPKYSRSSLHSAICHIGAGAFNRSHLAVYLDDLLHLGGEQHWGELGIGLMPGDEALSRALKAQGCLYGVLEKEADHTSYRVIGSIRDHLYAPENTAEVIARLSSPECKVISLTVTEGGYFIAAEPQGFEEHHPDIRHDLEAPDRPRTWLGYVAAAAERRMRSTGAPFTLMSCDNLQGNGNTARQALLAFADLRGGALRPWIEANVSFPNSMVDRITPRTTDADKERIAALYGIQDAAPVVCEPFRQWVLEDRFIAGRPAWERVGVQLTEDVTAYEILKMRVLNGGHSSFTYAAALLGKQEVAEALREPQLRQLLAAFHQQIRPILVVPPGVDLDTYMAGVAVRFGNEAIRDQVSRICSEGTAKMMKFILPSVREKLERGQSVHVLSFVVASWLRYQMAISEDGRRYTIADTLGSPLKAFVDAGGRQASLALSKQVIFGTLGTEPAFLTAVQQSLDTIARSGVRQALTETLHSTPTRRPS